MPIVKFLVGILGIAGGIYLALCGWLWFAQRRLMYLPSPVIEVTPTAFGVAYEDVWIPVDGPWGGQIHGWWLPASAGSELTILYLHGNAGNVSSNLAKALQLRSLGVSVLAIDYRGYGQSSGPFPSEQQLYDDALAAWQFLQAERGVMPHQLVVYGHSLGGAIGIELARRVPHLAGLVIEASFTSMADMASLSHYNRWFPVRQLLTQRFDSITKVKHLKVPTLYLHGMADLSVPATMGEALYQATQGPKSLWLVPKADHNDLPDWAGDEFKQRLHQFLQDYVLVQH
ncbi:alpha/beta hydrolase [Nodosilinea sp. PGN35]|uniref:alpha/beta hydrolase n=1 Tax=Nodosilinea sp. PGN35 TaxID=3020489 RepID=UPI0023B2B769|nr:alpha/beta hydrolase [Nodosilinea sp. TSF1-S3]MDF0368635.1 alpha/beta hydrolase [Nodosilinea sp. TSF1-S3]